MGKPAGGYGYHTYPDGLRAVYGARLIWPDDLVTNRQGVDHDDREACEELLEWLNETVAGADRRRCHELAETFEWASGDDREVTLYEDDRGVIVGNPNSSYGYVYIAAWLKDHLPKEENDAVGSAPDQVPGQG